MNKQTIISSAVGFIIAGIILLAGFLFVRMVIQDHRAISEVVGFINQQLAASQQAANSSSISPNTVQ